MFRMWTHNNVMEYKRNHRTVFFGHVFFHNFRYLGGGWWSELGDRV